MSAGLALLPMLLVAPVALGLGWVLGNAGARRAAETGRPSAAVIWRTLVPVELVLVAGAWLVAPGLDGLFGFETGGSGRWMVALYLTALASFAVAPILAALVAARFEHWRQAGRDGA